MKKNIYAILLLGLAVTACNDDYTEWYQDEVPEAEANAPMEKLQNVMVEPFVSSVIVSWDKPASEQYYYTLLSWTDGNGVVQNRKISKYSVDPENPNRIRSVVGGFTDTNTYNFTLTACSYSGVQSEPVPASAAPQPSDAAKDYVLSTVTLTNDVESAIVNWKNEIGATINLVFTYVDKSGKTQTATFDASVPKTEVIKNLPIEKTTVVTCKAVDPALQIETEPVTFDVDPLLTEWDIYKEGTNYICTTLWSNPGPTNMCDIVYKNDTKNEFTVTTTGGDPYCWWKNTTPLGNKFVMRYKSNKGFTFQIFLSFPPDGNIAPTIKLNKTSEWETVEWDLTGKFGEWQGGLIYPRFDWGSESGIIIEVRNAHFE